MPYTRALLDAIPMLEREPHAALPVISGQPPDPAALPEGCPFRPRCGSATDKCAKPPPLAEHEPEHWWACWHPVDAPVQAPLDGASVDTAAENAEDGATR
jgi:oligopeptide/dipeptide ABC transporter ATP-binding protein